jgi:hypothetical protein
MSKKAKKPPLEWLIEVNAEANREVAKEFLAEEDALRRVPCEDNKRRDLWRVNHHEITRLAENAESCGFKIKVWVRTGKSPARRAEGFLLPAALRKKPKRRTRGENKTSAKKFPKPEHLRKGERSPFD